MLQDIKLDDRSYQEIRDDAVANIVKHCPEWTNHNASDPGITIIELLSSMSEDIITRLNQVPDKNYLAFLDLIGIKQRLPRPSSTYVTFKLSEGYQNATPKKSTILIQEGSVIATNPKGDEESLLFETTKDLYISNTNLLHIYSKTFNRYRDRDDIVDNMLSLQKGEAFTPFSAQGASDNIMQLYLASNSFSIFADSANITLIFRLPTTMRLHKIPDNFLESMKWEFFDGASWHSLKVLNDFFFTLDDKDADILSVTFKGENAEIQKWVLEQFSDEETFYIRGTVAEAPTWLGEFAVYELSVVTASFPMGVLPEDCFHNFEQLNLNNDFYPFSPRPKVDNKMQEENFYIKSEEAFAIAGTSISINIKQSLNPEYILPKGNENLRLSWEYPGENNKWSYLKVSDSTKNFTQDGKVDFEIPTDMHKMEINGEEGYWIRCRLADGHYGEDEKSQYDEKSGSVVTTPSSLRPPVLSEVRIKYSKPREDIKNCYVLNNFKYAPLTFIDDVPTKLFDAEGDREESMFLAFDSFLSEDYLCLYFDIANDTSERNVFSQQRVIEWQLLQNGQWILLEEVVDETDGLTASGDVTIRLPKIEKLERNTLYIEEYERMWIKARVKYSSIHRSPQINDILLNSVAVVQQETFRNEIVGRSDGLPNLQFALNYKNLSQAPKITVGGEEFKAVERFIDYGKDDKVYRFNGIDGIVEFGDGEYGAIPKLGENILIEAYSITQGKAGNVNANELTVLRESINYIESVSNHKPSINGEDGDTLEDLKKYAPAVLKTMDRAISVEDYELLAQNFSPAIKRAKCISTDGDVMIIPLTETIIEDGGFINKKLVDDLYGYLKKRSLLTVDPMIVLPTIATVSVYMKLLYTVENYNVAAHELQDRILEEAQKYFDPFTGYKGEGFPLGKLINKSDFYTILHHTDNNIFINEIGFALNGAKNLIQSINLPHDNLVRIESIVVEELSYDV
jgi:hypothetical protein